MLEQPRKSLQVIDGGKTAGPPVEQRTHDLEAEAAVLCNVIHSPGAIDEVRASLTAEAFFSEAHRRIYETCIELADKAEPISTVTIMSALRASGRLAQVGGPPYLIELANAAPVLLPSHLQAHARVVRDLAVRRALGVLGQTVVSRIANDSASIEVLLADTRASLDELAQVVTSSEVSIRADAVAERVVTALTKAGATPGIGARPTGFDRLDRLIAGLSDELTVVGARPGMGKTALATGIATNVAKRGAGVYVASLETSETPLFTRMACAEARVDLHRARLGTLNQTELKRFLDASRAIAELPLWLDTESVMTARDLWGRCRRLQLQLAREGRKLELVVVDYVQLLRASAPKMQREQVIAENARALKAMAQELACTVLGLSQLNREVEHREDKRPQLADLRESGELEQCARTVILLYRADYYSRRNPDYAPTGIVEVDVAKANNGPTGHVRLGFHEQSTGFFNLAEGT